jgi:hypothetical protein
LFYIEEYPAKLADQVDLRCADFFSFYPAKLADQVDLWYADLGFRV